jgi:hypothetical protein
MLLSMIGCSLQNGFSMKSTFDTGYCVYFQKATQTRQLRLLFVAFHLDKALCSTKDNIFFRDFWK